MGQLQALRMACWDLGKGMDGKSGKGGNGGPRWQTLVGKGKLLGDRQLSPPPCTRPTGAVRGRGKGRRAVKTAKRRDRGTAALLPSRGIRGGGRGGWENKWGRCVWAPNLG